MDITSGEVRVNLNEDLLLKEKSLADTSPDLPQEVVQENKESDSDEKQQGKKSFSAVCKYSSIIPEKVHLISTAFLFSFHCLTLSFKITAYPSGLYVGTKGGSWC